MVKQFESLISIEGIICLVGTILFASWLLRTSLGRKSLADSMPRRNNMPVYLPFIPLFIWLVSVPLAILITRKLVGESAPGEVKTLQDWQSIFLDNLIFCIGAIIIVLVIIFLARATFARRLKGFGLNVKTIYKDFLAAFLSLLSIWPLILAMLILTVYLGKVLFGQDYKMPRHEELRLITIYRQLPLRILIVITAVVAAPLLEEMLFRGLFQTLIRSYLEQKTEDRIQNTEASSILYHPSLRLRSGQASIVGRGTWLSIIITSIIFTTIHYNLSHWPALFV